MQRTGNFFASPLLRLKAVFLVLTITVFWGCSLGEIKNRPTAGTLGRSPGNAEITRTPHQVFDLKTIIPPGQQPQVEVRLARPGEISKLWPASFFEGMSAGSAIAAAGVGVSLLCSHGARRRCGRRHCPAGVYCPGNHEPPPTLGAGKVYGRDGFPE